MSDKHWAETDLIASLYGVGPQDDHPENCAHCRERLRRLLLRREQLRARAPEPSEALLAAQRRAITERLHGPAGNAPGMHLRPLTVTAAILLLLTLVTVFRPLPTSLPTRETTVKELATEDKLFEEVYSMVSDPEPEAVQPVRFVFEVTQ